MLNKDFNMVKEKNFTFKYIKFLISCKLIIVGKGVHLLFISEIMIVRMTKL